MSQLSLEQVKVKIEGIASKIGVESIQRMVTFGYTEDGAKPNIEVDCYGYHFVVVERGMELRRDTTNELQDFLFIVFSNITHQAAVEYELHHRVKGQDCRRLMFSKQIELLKQVDEGFAERKREQIDKILQKYPYDDELYREAELRLERLLNNEIRQIE